MERNREREKQAFAICQEKIAEHKLDMKLVSAEYSFDGSKILFFFTSEGRVDFRALVKDLAGALHTRIELRQIGVRDEAKMLGGRFSRSLFRSTSRTSSAVALRTTGRSGAVSSSSSTMLFPLTHWANSIPREVSTITPSPT